MPLSNLGAIMDAIAQAALTANVTKRAYGWPAQTINPPCVVVGYPVSVDFDETFNRGADRLVIPVYFLAGRVVEKAARDELSAIIVGATGIKDALDGSLGGIIDTLRVTDMRVLNVQIAGTEYLGARFDAEVIT